MPRGINDYDTAKLQGRNIANSNALSIVSPGLITNGLVVHSDFGNYASYPLSGSTVFDLSGNRVNGTITQPTSSIANGGVLTFGASSTTIVSLNTTTVPPAGDISVFAWVYLTSFNLIWNIIVLKWLNPDGSDFHWSLKSATSNGTNVKQNLYTTNNSDMYGTSTFSTNTWYYVGFVLVNNGTLTFYTNAAADGTVANVSRTAQASTLQYGDNRDFQLRGNLSQIQIYSRALSPEEVKQNFDATRARFGL